MGSIRDIHPSFKDIDQLERAKIGVEFFVANLRARNFTSIEMDKLARHFTNEVKGLEYNQTS